MFNVMLYFLYNNYGEVLFLYTYLYLSTLVREEMGFMLEVHILEYGVDNQVFLLRLTQPVNRGADTRARSPNLGDMEPRFSDFLLLFSCNSSGQLVALYVFQVVCLSIVAN